MYLATKPPNRRQHLADAAVIGADDLTQIFRIEPRRQFGRADHIAEHDRQLAPLGRGGVGWLGSGPAVGAAVASGS